MREDKTRQDRLDQIRQDDGRQDEIKVKTPARTGRGTSHR